MCVLPLIVLTVAYTFVLCCLEFMSLSFSPYLCTDDLSTGDGALGIELGAGQAVSPGVLNQQEVAAIRLPASLFQDITDNRTNVGVFFAVYSVSYLFPVQQDPANENITKRTVVGSRILASTVGPGLDFSNLTEPVSIVLRLVTDVSTHNTMNDKHFLIY